MKLVCFDFDGTIADSFDFIYESYSIIFKKYAGIEMTSELFRSLSGPVEEGIFKYYFKDKYDPKMFEEYMDYYKKEAHKKIKLFPGIKELLTELKNNGVNLIYASGRQDLTSIISLNDEKIYDLFIGHYYGGMENHSIKDKILKQISIDYKIDPKDMIYVGDMPQDVIDCNKVGCSCISVLFTHPEVWDDILKINKENSVRTVEELKSKIYEFLNK